MCFVLLKNSFFQNIFSGLFLYRNVQSFDGSSQIYNPHYNS